MENGEWEERGMGNGEWGMGKREEGGGKREVEVNLETRHLAALGL